LINITPWYNHDTIQKKRPSGSLTTLSLSAEVSPRGIPFSFVEPNDPITRPRLQGILEMLIQTPAHMSLPSENS